MFMNSFFGFKFIILNILKWISNINSLGNIFSILIFAIASTLKPEQKAKSDDADIKQ